MAEPDETPQKYEPLTGAKKAQYEADMRLAEREAEKKKKQTLKEFEDALAKAKASPPPESPLAGVSLTSSEKDDLVKFIEDTQAKAIEDTKKPGDDYFEVKAGGETFEFGTPPPPPIGATLGASDSGGAAGAYGGGEFDVTGAGEIAPAMFDQKAGALLAKGLLYKKQKRSDLRKGFGKALRTGLETLTGEARQANVRALRDEMVGQGLTTAENFNRVGRKMMKDIEAERFKARGEDPAYSAYIKTPGLDKLEAMQRRPFGSNTALQGSVGGLKDAPRALGTQAGRLRREARALERRGYRREAGGLRAAAAMTGEPSISTPAYREGQRAAEEELQDLRRRQTEAQIAYLESLARRNNSQFEQQRGEKPTVNPNSTSGAGRGRPIKKQ